jgi:hypothetical protein
MGLNKTDLKNDIASIMTDMMERENTSIDEFATRLSDAIDSYVKQASVVYTSGLMAPNGNVVGNFNGRLE